MPRGGVDETGSETAGGSSGSGGGGMGTPVLRVTRRVRARKVFSSSSPSGAGGGSGRGLGLTGVLRGGLPGPESDDASAGGSVSLDRADASRVRPAGA